MSAPDADRPHWAERIHAERKARGWTQAQAVTALRLHVDGNPPSDTHLLRMWKKWEKGKHFPRQYKQAIAAMFGTPPAAFFARPSSAHAPLSSWRLRSSGISTATLKVDPDVIEDLRLVREALVISDSMLGAQPVIQSATDQVTVIEGLLRHTPAALRGDLFEMGALYAEMVGWLHDDVGNIDAGHRWSARALEWAHASDRYAIVAYVLMRKAQQATAVGDAASTVGLAGSVRPDGIPATVFAAAAQQRAHGHAIDGDRRSTQEALDQAYEAISAGAETDNPFALGEFCTPAYLHAQRGACLVKLGRPLEAVTAFDDALVGWPPTYRRERGLHLARKAVALAAAGEPTESAAVGLQSLAVVRTTHSARTVAELTTVVELLGSVDSTDHGVAAFRAEHANTLIH